MGIYSILYTLLSMDNRYHIVRYSCPVTHMISQNHGNLFASLAFMQIYICTNTSGSRLYLAWPWNCFFALNRQKMNFRKLKECFFSVFLSNSVKTIFRIKRSFGVILVILGHFCKTEKARTGAISWTDIGSVWSPLSIFKKLARWHPMPKRFSRF